MNKQFEEIITLIGTRILGKEEQVRFALTCLFARGHLLIEDQPGIGKTTLAKVLSSCLGLDFHRIQFTSDMLPGDILGTSVFDGKSGSFTFHPGPIFTNILLVDEINRATPKTQSALLEAMEERQVTVEGETRPLENPFFVIATQNPLEHAGTFPLPDSQLDRFLMRIRLGYPPREAEKKLLMGDGLGTSLHVKSRLTPIDVKEIQKKVDEVHISDHLYEYLQDIVDFTRRSTNFHTGLSPRASLALLRATRSWAYIHGKDHAIPEDLQKILPWVSGHRLRGKEDLEEFTTKRLMDILMEVPIP